eukprot:scaffold19780_cov17-Tisochrysis_lutea.AAC.1
MSPPIFLRIRHKSLMHDDPSSKLTIFLHFCNALLQVQIEEEEAVAEGLPTRKQFLSTKGVSHAALLHQHCKLAIKLNAANLGTFPFKAVLRRLGGFQVTTYVTVERAKVMERGLLINNKTEFAE